MKRALLLGLLASFVAFAACNKSAPAPAEGQPAATEAVKAAPAEPAKPAAPADKPAVEKPVAKPAEKPAEATKTFTPAELPPVDVPAFDYPEFTGQKIAILHTENVIGELEDCGWKANRLGGLAKKKAYIDAHQKDWNGLLIIDSGDLFFKTATVLEASLPQARANAELMVDLFNTIGCHAFNVGDRDLAAGPAVIKALEKKAKFPFISSNIQDAKTGKLLFADHAIAKAAGHKFGFIGLLSPRARLRKGPDGDEFKVVDPVGAAKEIAAKLEKQGVDTIVLLSQLMDDERDAVLAAVPSIKLVFGGQNPLRRTVLSPVGEDALLALGYMRGKYVGQTTLHVVEGSDSLVYRGEADAFKDEVKQLDLRIRRQERSAQRMLDKPGGEKSRIDYYERSIKKYLDQRADLVEKIKALKPVDPKASFLTFELVPMDKKITDDAALKALVAKFKAEHPEPLKAPPRGAMKGTRAGGLKPIKPSIEKPKLDPATLRKMGKMRKAAPAAR